MPDLFLRLLTQRGLDTQYTTVHACTVLVPLVILHCLASLLVSVVSCRLRFTMLPWVVGVAILWMCPTVLLGAKERGVQPRSLESFLIFLIPADLRSYLRSICGHESSATPKFCTQNALWNHVFPNLIISSNFRPCIFLKNLEFQPVRSSAPGSAVVTKSVHTYIVLCVCLYCLFIVSWCATACTISSMCTCIMTPATW